MPKLTQNTLLRRVPDLDLHLDGNNTLTIETGGRRVEGGRHALAILAELSRPRTVSEVLAALQPGVRGAAGWRELTACLVGLHEAGVLRDDSRETPPARRPLVGYATSPVHIRMLDDRTRTQSFLDAISRVVRPGDVVVDLGTGTGVLAVAAARAGARRVYAIEPTEIGESAAEVFAANGLADRITLVRGWSTEVELPERGDVLISEMIGDDPLAERLLAVTADAVKRLLQPAARLIPSRLEMYGLPVTVPPAKLEKQIFAPRTLSRWHSWYGIDFAPLAAAARTRPRAFFFRSHRARRWRTLSEGVPLLAADLKAVQGSVVRRTSVATARTRGLLSGVLVYFEAELAPGARLSTAPADADERNHWYSPVWLPEESLMLEEGESFTMTYARDAPDQPDGVSVARHPGR